jgi:hypothetical protein
MQEFLRYASGEEIQLGDYVLHDGFPAQIKLIASDPDGPEENWYIQTSGIGVMLVEAKIFGRLFTPAIEPLEFIDRGNLETSHEHFPFCSIC